MKNVLLSEKEAAEAAGLVIADHRVHRARHPWLPGKNEDEYAGRIAWMARAGRITGLRDGGRLVAFLGRFDLDDYRNECRAAFTPDWCLGAGDGQDRRRCLRILIRETLREIHEVGTPIHAASVPADCDEYREAFELTGYGRIVMDAARPVEALIEELGRAGDGVPRLEIRRAEGGDRDELADMEGRLAEHIASSPVFMPDASRRSAEQWREWLARPDAAAFIAVINGRAAGFISAQDPTDDVSFAVHGPDTIAINGMFVRPEERGKELGAALLGAMAAHAARAGKPLVSVDCETINPEAFAFWTRHFTPVAWSLERRLPRRV